MTRNQFLLDYLTDPVNVEILDMKIEFDESRESEEDFHDGDYEESEDFNVFVKQGTWAYYKRKYNQMSLGARKKIHGWIDWLWSPFIVKTYPLMD